MNLKSFNSCLLLLTIILFSNLSAQWEFKDHSISGSDYSAYGVYAVDIDNDQDIDVITCSFNNDEIIWCENLGNNIFDNHIISTDVNATTSVYAIDIDGDGDMDVLSASAIDDKIAWYENDGFQDFVPHIISTTANGAYGVFAIDVDGDSDIDVLSASDQDDRVAWYENDGEENFTTHTITTNTDGVHIVYAIDLDGDSDIDVLSASWLDDKIAWFENDGEQNFSEHVITSIADGARSVFAIDLDSDSDIDVLTTSLYDKTVSWYENDGDEKFTFHSLTDSLGDAISVYATDMDWDGDNDIIAVGGSDNRILLFENMGEGYFIEHVVTTQAERVTQVYVEDINGDGNQDIITSQWEGDMIKWYEQVPDITKITTLFFYNHHVFEGDTICVPLNIQFAENDSVSSAEIEIGGYVGQLNLLELVTDSSLSGDAGWLLESNEVESKLKVWLAGSKDIYGTGILFWLKFEIPESSSNPVPLTIESAIFNTGTSLIKKASGKIIIFPNLYGDVDLNGRIGAYDASLVLKEVVGKANLDTFQIANADVSLDKTLSALDATYILQFGVGLIDSLPYDSSVGVPVVSGTILTINQDIYLGEMLSLPVYIVSGKNILSFEGEIHFNAKDLVFNEIVWSENLDGLLVEVNSLEGLIKFCGAITEPYNEAEDEFCTLKFDVAEDLDSDSTVVSIEKFRWNEDKVISHAADISLINKGISNLPGLSTKIPKTYNLSQNYPNPFNPETVISYQLPSPAHVILSIFNVNGQEVITLVSEYKAAGNHKISFNANNLSSGVYYYRIKTNAYTQIKKMVLLK